MRQWLHGQHLSGERLASDSMQKGLARVLEELLA